MFFTKLNKENIKQFKIDIQEAFQMGAIEGGYPTSDEPILPERDIDRSLNANRAVAYVAVDNGKIVGGAVVVADNKQGHLELLYVKYGYQSRGIGKFIWNQIEQAYPSVTEWETYTPYFEKRNIHFYVNVLGFHVVEFFHKGHQGPHFPDDGPSDLNDDGMFRFIKKIK